MELFLTVLALVPSLAWMYWIWRRDKYQREPKSLVLLLLVVGGLIAVVGTLVVVTLYESSVPSMEAAPVINMLLTAALPEEFFKMLPVFLFAWRSKHWDEPFDGIVYAGATALGFNLIETAGYMFAEESIGGSLFQGIVRGTLGGHMVYGIIMGFFLSRAKFTVGGARWWNIALAWFVPTAFHTAWNAALTYGGEIIAGDVLAGMLAWGLSTALWLLAFAYMRQNRDGAYGRPLARTVQLAPTPCAHCRGAYPHGAKYCQTCGAQVGMVAHEA
jgi:RsiW-degrading membrane proteinase PrsW (M82 family)